MLTTGIHPGVPADVYHALPHCSNSKLSLLARSPSHLKNEMDNPSAPTPAMILGDAVHLCILQPELFDGRYVVAGRCEAMTGKGERCTNGGNCRIDGQWYCGVHGKKVISKSGVEKVSAISQDDYDKCQRMRDSIWRHPRAGDLLGGEGHCELSCIYQDPTSGVLVKMRLDRLSDKYSAIVDIKTTSDARREAFERSIFNFGYHRQGAGYLRGWDVLGRSADAFAIIAVESERPHSVKVYQLEPEAIQRGLDELDYLLGVYADCEKSGRWPGYEETIDYIGIPAWEYRKGLVTL